MSTDILDTPEAGPAAIRGATVRLAGYVASVALSVISAAVLLRYLGAGRFGQYATIFSLMTIVQGLSDAGTIQIGIREYAVGRPAERARMLASLQGMRLVLTVAGVVVALAFALVAGYSDAMVLGAALYGLGLIITVYALTLLVPLQAELRLVAVTALDLLRQASTVVALVAGVVLSAGVAVFLAVPIPVGILLAVATILVVRRTVPLLPRVDLPEWRRLAAETVPFGAAVAVGILYSYVTVLIMSLVTTETETGYFGAGHRIFFVLAQIPGLLVTTAFPILARAARDDHERLRYAIQRLFEVLLLTGAGIGLLVAAGAGAAIDVVAGPDYDPSVPVLRILGIALAATAIIALGSFGLLSLRRYRALIVCNAAGLVVTSVLTLVLAPDRGAEGAAVALVIGEVVLGTTLFVTLSRSAGLRPSFAVVPRVVLVVALAAIPGLLLGLPAVPAAVAAAVVFAVGTIVLRVLPEEVADAFRQRLDAARGRHTPPPSAPS